MMTERKTLEKILLTKVNLFTNRMTVGGTSTTPVYTLFCEIAALQSQSGCCPITHHTSLSKESTWKSECLSPISGQIKLLMSSNVQILKG